jgi:hypothetical protein
MMRGIDRDDIFQAVEIALGDMLGGESDSRRSVSDDMVMKMVGRLRRVMAELPGETMVQDILEALEE